MGASGLVTTLLDRDPAAHTSLDNPPDVAWLLGVMQETGASDQVTTLASRAAAHTSVGDPAALVDLLGTLREVGASDQVATLASRAAAHTSLDDPADFEWLLNRLPRASGQAAQLTERLPAAGMFGLFLEQPGVRDRFAFGREADGTPAAPWDLDDLG